ncbi:MAG: hypothetical protein HY236_14435 [Acidobacteria bacterium]|nr:hypothetical protein [Acidobacteriota bacterium]
MSLVDAVRAVGLLPPNTASRERRSRYCASLAGSLALEIAEGLRSAGFPNVRPARARPGEAKSYSGPGRNIADVSSTDEQYGPLLAVSIKVIAFPPFGKNLKNCCEELRAAANALHLRFPFSVVCGIVAFLAASSPVDIKEGRCWVLLQRASRLFEEINGRRSHRDPGERLEDITMMLFQPPMPEGIPTWIKLLDVKTQGELSEAEYCWNLRGIHNHRNPGAAIGPAPDQIQPSFTSVCA